MLGKIRSGLKKAKNAGGQVLQKGGKIGLETAKAAGGMAINQATAGLIDKFGPKFGMVLSRTEDVLTQGEAIVEGVNEQKERLENVEAQSKVNGGMLSDLLKKLDSISDDVKEIGAKVDKLAAYFEMIEENVETESEGDDGVHSENTD